MKFRLLRRTKIQRAKQHQWGKGERCYWCGRPVHYVKRFAPGVTVPRDVATREHYIPKADGGNHNQKNIVVACAGCNHARRRDMNWVPYFLHDQRPLPGRQAAHISMHGCYCRKEHMAA